LLTDAFIQTIFERLLKYHHHRHHLSRETSTAGYWPPPKFSTTIGPALPSCSGFPRPSPDRRSTLWGAYQRCVSWCAKIYPRINIVKIVWTMFEELDSPVVSALGVRSLKLTLSPRAPPCFGRHAKPLVPAAFAVVSTHQSALGPRGGLWPVLLVGNP
jgi:hypothetical protein